MKGLFRFAASLAAWLVAAGTVHAASFAYHGTLQDAGKPAEGSYDIELTLYSAPGGGSVIGGPLVMYKVPVHGGSFNTQADFGALTQAFSHAFVGVKVRSDGDRNFVALSARSPVTADATASVCPGAWTLGGNAGNPAGSYLGTADGQPLTLKVNGVGAGQITPNGNSAITLGPNVVFGMEGNNVAAAIGGATIAGGGAAVANCGAAFNSSCLNSVLANFATVSGGIGNAANGPGSAVAGGKSNTASGAYSTVAGAANDATGLASAVIGGGYGTAGGIEAIVVGGENNTASGDDSFVAGGTGNTAGGTNSFAAGTDAVVRTQDHGTFVWADNSNVVVPFTSAGPNQFLIRAGGGVGINTNSPFITDPVSLYVKGLDTTTGTAVFGSPKGVNLSHVHYGPNGDWYIRSAVGTGASTAQSGRVIIQDLGGYVTIGTSTVAAGALISTGANGAYLSNTGVWTNGSSSTFKEGFSSIDTGSILAKVLGLPITTWRYKLSDDSHIGPMAEDFKAAFGLGGDAQHIGTIDEEGVALAAIQGLNQKEQSDNAALRRENAELRSRLDEVTTRLTRLEDARGQ